MKIPAQFTAEHGDWVEKEEQYTGVHQTVSMREVDMVIDKASYGNIIRFIGGPTGHEAYYIEDLLRHNPRHKRGGDFCICAGTINSWDKCVVQWEDVLSFLKDNGYEEK